MDKRYQVFVSSTFLDLQEERKQVIQALLELDCIPSGMELFQASDEDQWTLIKRVIDDCDYYLIIMAGRYGSMKDGVSYTEMEYDYAISQGKPVIAFLHQDPGAIESKHVEKNAEAQAKLQAFRSKAEKKPCRYWRNSEDLGGKVSRSYVRLIKDRPAEGWVKSRYADNSEEIMRVRARVLELEHELAVLRSQPPEGWHRFAQGDDKITVRLTYKKTRKSSKRYWSNCDTSWNFLWQSLSDYLVREFSTQEWKQNIARRLAPILASKPIKGKKRQIIDPDINLSNFNTILFQSINLNCIRIDLNKPMEKRLSLTPYGTSMVMKSWAVYRNDDEIISDPGVI
jgi:nucleoside 2-deoxyribosyltransferase